MRRARALHGQAERSETTASPPTAKLASGEQEVGADHAGHDSSPAHAGGRQHSHGCCG